MNTYTKTSKRNIYKTAAGTYRARVTKNGVVHSFYATTLKQANEWLMRIKAMKTTPKRTTLKTR